MSYPKGDQPAHTSGRGQDQRPSFDRPSLFAGMEDDDVSDDTRRVRILSTLESTRPNSRPGRNQAKRRQTRSKSSAWFPAALWGVLGLGLLALIAGFVMVIQDSKPARPHAAPAADLPEAQARSGTAPPARPDRVATVAPTAGPAVIETTAVNPKPVAVGTELPAAASPALAKVSSTSPDTRRTLAQPGATARADHAAPTALGPAITAKPPGKPTNNAAKGQDEDVALLEAMFAHTGRKAAPPSSSPKH